MGTVAAPSPQSANVIATMAGSLAAMTPTCCPAPMPRRASQSASRSTASDTIP